MRAAASPYHRSVIDPSQGVLQPRHQRISTAAVAGCVLGLIGLGPFALAFSIIGFLETRDGDVDGRPFAVVGLVLGVVGTSVLAAWVGVWLTSRG